MEKRCQMDFWFSTPADSPCENENWRVVTTIPLIILSELWLIWSLWVFLVKEFQSVAFQLGSIAIEKVPEEVLWQKERTGNILDNWNDVYSIAWSRWGGRLGWGWRLVARERRLTGAARSFQCCCCCYHPRFRHLISKSLKGNFFRWLSLEDNSLQSLSLLQCWFRMSIYIFWRIETVSRNLHWKLISSAFGTDDS